MNSVSQEEIKERYHVAKLALFNVHLLASLRGLAEKDKELARIVAEEARENGMGEVPNLINQSTFLQFAYISLVWLWEAAKAKNLEGQLLKNLPGVATRKQFDLPSKKQINGERIVNDWRSVIRLLRNAISHSNVQIKDTSFIFGDQDSHGNPREKEPTYLTLSWEELAKVSEAVIHAIGPVLFPETRNISEKH